MNAQALYDETLLHQDEISRIADEIVEKGLIGHPVNDQHPAWSMTGKTLPTTFTRIVALRLAENRGI